MRQCSTLFDDIQLVIFTKVGWYFSFRMALIPLSRITEKEKLPDYASLQKLKWLSSTLTLWWLVSRLNLDLNTYILSY
jgi:hypothetical protein